MGKSVMTLGLVLSRPRPADSPGTLVLCPVALLANWQVECAKALPEAASVLVVNSARKSKLKAAELAQYDVVISAYSLLKGSPVLDVRWHRLVCDESTELRTTSAAKTRAVASIRAIRRWALSGTPMPNGPA